MKINTQLDKLKSYNPDVNFFDTGAITKLASNVARGVSSIGGSSINAFDSAQSLLLQQQQELQIQMMLTTMQSNILRTEHETKMAAVRNMRVA